VTVSWSAAVSFKLPEVPVIVTVTVPVVAVELAVRLRVLVVVAGFGLNDAVTPGGNPDAARMTSPVNPFTGVTVTVLFPSAPPLAIVSASGEADKVKLFTKALTLRLRVVEFVNVPDVPVIFTVAAPVVAVEAAVRVNVLVLVPGFGLNAAVIPVGRPDAERVTSPVKPFVASMLIVVVAFPPCTRASVSGSVDKAKFGAIPGQLFTRLKALMLPIPVAKSHPVVAVYAGS
jgi:hypothetical protein